MTKIVNPLPAATRHSAQVVTMRTPKRSIRAAANGAVSPYSSRFTLIAAEIAVVDPAEFGLQGGQQRSGRRPETGCRDQGQADFVELGPRTGDSSAT